MKNKKWTQLSSETLNRRYNNFLRFLWYNGFSGLGDAKLFRNKKGTKEIIKIGRKIFKIKLKNKER